MTLSPLNRSLSILKFFFKLIHVNGETQTFIVNLFVEPRGGVQHTLKAIRGFLQSVRKVNNIHIFYSLYNILKSENETWVTLCALKCYCYYQQLLFRLCLTQINKIKPVQNRKSGNILQLSQDFCTAINFCLAILLFYSAILNFKPEFDHGPCF